MDSVNPHELLLEIKESGKTVLVVGLGISGLESLKFLARNGIKAIGVDRASPEQFQRSNKFPNEYEEVERCLTPLLFGIDSLSSVLNLSSVSNLSSVLDKAEIALAILSPGIPLNSALVEELRSCRVPIISEFELGLELLQRPTIIVTGSNGKSTTVSLIHHILTNSGIESFLCGNVGTPVIAGVPSLEAPRDGNSSRGWVVAEASSYQLESCQVLKPKIAVFLNITENHLERHGTFENYLAAKVNLFLRMNDEGMAIYPESDPNISRQLSGLSVKKVPIRYDGPASRIYLENGESSIGAASIRSGAVNYEQVTVSSSNGDCIVQLKDLNLIGGHNRLNAAFAVTAALMAGADARMIEQALRSFSALEHRLRRVPGAKELWINDSKSTTVAATVAALNSIVVDYPQHQVTLLVGGQMKIGSWLPLTELINLNFRKIKQLIIFGGDREKIQASLEGVQCDLSLAERVNDAIRLAEPSARAGDVILFSPGALSFDEFRSFGERGEAFERLVREVSG